MFARSRLIMSGILLVALSLSPALAAAQAKAGGVQEAVKQYESIRSGDYSLDDVTLVQGEQSTLEVTLVRESSPSVSSDVEPAAYQQISCKADILVGEKTSASDPGAFGSLTLLCASSDVTGTGSIALEFYNRETGRWEPLGSKYTAIGVGQTVDVFVRHNSPRVASEHRLTASFDLTCTACFPAKLAGTSPSNPQLGKFFSSWTTFDTGHYQKHAVTQNEWLPRPTKMEYLAMARSAATYAQLVAQGSIWDSTYHASMVSSNLYGYDSKSNDVVIVNQTTAVYPVLGTYYKWMSQYDPYQCPTGLDHFRRISTGSSSGTNCAR